MAALTVGAGILTGLEILSGLLTVSAQAQAAAMRINELLQRAKAEGRDVTNQELQDLMAERHALEQDLLARLEAPAVPSSPEPAPGGRRARKR